MKHLLRLLLLMMVMAVAVPTFAGAWSHDRDGFAIGFNLGGGVANSKPHVGEDSSGGGGAAAFRLGWALNNQILLGFESTAWAGDTEFGGEFTLVSNKFNFTWYPAASGWFLRGGVGWGTAELKGVLIGRTVTISESGGSFGLGGGHEWRLTRTFALGLALDYGAIGLDDWDFGFTNFTVQLNWYL